jgi:hypothetical protein
VRLSCPHKSTNLFKKHLCYSWSGKTWGIIIYVLVIYMSLLRLVFSNLSTKSIILKIIELIFPLSNLYVSCYYLIYSLIVRLCPPPEICCSVNSRFFAHNSSFCLVAWDGIATWTLNGLSWLYDACFFFMSAQTLSNRPNETYLLWLL